MVQRRVATDQGVALQIDWDTEQLRMHEYVAHMVNVFNAYISTAIVKMSEAKGQMAAVTGQARD